MSFKGWREYKVSELGKVVTGKTPPTKDKENFGVEYPFITPIDMKGEKHVFESTRNLSATGKNRMKNFLLPADTVCVSCIGSDLGKVIKTTRESFTNQQINSIICNEKFDSDFVFYALKFISPELRSVGHHSTAVPIINKSDFSQFKIRAPESKADQYRISSILSSLDDKLELNLQTNQTIEAIAQALFKEWFVDFHFPNSTGEMQERELGLIPKDWKAGTIGDMFTFSKETINPSLFEKDIFLHYSLPAFDSGRYPIKELGSQILSNKLKVKANSILVSKLNPRIPRIWPIVEVNENCICSTEFQVLVPNRSYYFSFGVNLFWQTQVIETMKGRATGTSGSHQRIRPQDILDIKIAIPPDEILSRFNTAVRGFYDTIDLNKEQSQTLTSLRDTLLPKLMKGEISISETEKLTAAAI